MVSAGPGSFIQDVDYTIQSNKKERTFEAEYLNLNMTFRLLRTDKNTFKLGTYEKSLEQFPARIDITLKKIFRMSLKPAW